MVWIEPEWFRSSLSPYFLAWSLPAIHLRASTRSWERRSASPFSFQPMLWSSAFLRSIQSLEPSSAISRISSNSASACSSRARAYCSENDGCSANHLQTVDVEGIASSVHMERRLSPSAMRSQMMSAVSWVNVDLPAITQSVLVYAARRYRPSYDCRGWREGYSSGGR